MAGLTLIVICVVASSHGSSRTVRGVIERGRAINQVSHQIQN